MSRFNTYGYKTTNIHNVPGSKRPVSHILLKTTKNIFLKYAQVHMNRDMVDTLSDTVTVTVAVLLQLQLQLQLQKGHNSTCSKYCKTPLSICCIETIYNGEPVYYLFSYI